MEKEDIEKLKRTVWTATIIFSLIMIIFRIDDFFYTKAIIDIPLVISFSILLVVSSKKVWKYKKIEDNTIEPDAEESLLNDHDIPKYCTDMSWTQNSDLSITTEDGRYDLTRFSPHESDTIHHVLNVVKEKYPQEYQSIGLANESYGIKYKARYILFEAIIIKYADSDSFIDNFAVALAYESKGAYFRKQAIEYFEKSEPYISTDFMKDFVSYMPLHVYTMFAKLYEQEHDYDKAIYYTEKARCWSIAGNVYFNDKIKELLEKQSKNAPIRNMKMSERQKEFEKDVTAAANYFLGKSDSLPKRTEHTKEFVFLEQKKPIREYHTDLERYAVMCNAYMERQDEMEEYKND